MRHSANSQRGCYPYTVYSGVTHTQKTTNLQKKNEYVINQQKKYITDEEPNDDMVEILQ